MRKSTSVALGGMLAAAAIVIMCLGGMIPVATYVCPILCTLLLWFVLRSCGKKMAWAWYLTVALLSALVGPDKEASAVFLLFGYYPIVKLKLDCARLRWLWKLLLFNSGVMVLYGFLLRVIGLESLYAEEPVGNLFLVVLLVMGNVVFVLLDKLLDMMEKKRWK